MYTMLVPILLMKKVRPKEGTKCVLRSIRGGAGTYTPQSGPRVWWFLNPCFLRRKRALRMCIFQRRAVELEAREWGNKGKVYVMATLGKNTVVLRSMPWTSFMGAQEEKEQRGSWLQLVAKRLATVQGQVYESKAGFPHGWGQRKCLETSRLGSKASSDLQQATWPLLACLSTRRKWNEWC